MEIVEVSDWEADFRDRVKYKREYYENQIVKTNINNIQLRVIKDNQGWDYGSVFYVAIEDTDDFDNVIGAVELIERHYPGMGDVFEPHSFMHKDYRGKGYVEGVYRWVLDNNFRLMSGERQTVCSDGLWKKLSADYEFSYYNSCEEDFITESELSEEELQRYWVRKTLKKVDQ